MTKCFVPGCKSGYDSTKGNGRKISLFRAPKDKAALKKWQVAIPRKDRKITSSDSICELHFDDSEIARFFDREKTLERERPKLAAGAIPSKFPNCPEHLWKRAPPPTRKTREQRQRERAISDDSAVQAAEIKGNDLSDHCGDIPVGDKGPTTLDGKCTVTVDASVINPNLESLESITIEELRAETLNRENWTKLLIGNTLRFLYWPNGQVLCEKYVEIGEDLTVKVAFGRVRTGFVGFKRMTSLHKLNELMEMMEGAKICCGAMSSQHKRCGGFAKAGKDHCGTCILLLTLASGGIGMLRNMEKHRGRHINQNMK